MIYVVDMASCGMIYIPSFIKISTVFRAILRLYLRNMRRCNVGITEGRYLRITPLRWAQVP
jgi:hypothetical protein